MEVAEKLFSRFGFEKISMDRIARESKHAKGSLYYHFSSKKELINSIIAKEIDGLRSKLLEILNDSSISDLEKIRTYIYARMSLINESFSYHKALKDRVLKDHNKETISDFREQHDSFINWEKEQLTAVVVNGKNKGAFPSSINAVSFAEATLMYLTSLEIPFFIFDRYEKSLVTFKYSTEEFILKSLK